LSSLCFALHGHRNLGAVVVGVIWGGVAAAAGKGRDKEGEHGHMPPYEFSNWLYNYALDLCTLGIIVIYVLDLGTIFMFKHDIIALWVLSVYHHHVHMCVLELMTTPCNPWLHPR
jgi:hypothetical protein